MNPLRPTGSDSESQFAKSQWDSLIGIESSKNQSDSIRIKNTTRGTSLELVRVLSKKTQASIKQYSFVDMWGDTLRCSDSSGADVLILKPTLLRQSVVGRIVYQIESDGNTYPGDPYLGAVGFSYATLPDTLSSIQTRVATTLFNGGLLGLPFYENQTIFPAYSEGDVVFAIKIDYKINSTTNTTDSGFDDVDLLDVNLDRRRWIGTSSIQNV